MGTNDAACENCHCLEFYILFMTVAHLILFFNINDMFAHDFLSHQISELPLFFRHLKKNENRSHFNTLDYESLTK